MTDFFSLARRVRGATPALARPLAALGLLLATAGAAQAQTTTNFAYTGGTQSYTVPAGITKLNITATGAAGGGNRNNNLGGLGAVVQATVTVVPGEILTVVVGSRGGEGNGGTNATGGAGGYNGGGNGSYTGGGGGGATDLRRAAANGSTGDYFASRNALLVAGGGGGGDAGVGGPSPVGGSGGTPNGGNGVSAQGGGPGLGATTTALGGGYPGSNGTGGNGNPGNFNAAGGGGYYGGGGGGNPNPGVNGGGGGSSYVLPTGSSNVSYSLASSRANGALAITTVPPPTNNALAFDGSDDYVRIPDNNSLVFGAGNFTVEAWVLKQANSSSYSNAVVPGGKWNTGASAGTNEWLLYTTANGSDNLPSFLLESGTTTYAANGTTPVPLNLWTHLTGVRQGGSLLLYVNGVLQATTAIPATAAVNNVAGRDLLLGAIANNGSTGYFANARLDELRIYNTALTAAQIQADMFSTTSALPSSQVAYYNFDQGTAGGTNAGLTTLTDQSGNGNTGTLTNFALTGTSSNWVRSFPTITGISPTTGKSGTSVTVTGTNLTDATSFAFNGLASAGFTTPTSDLTATITAPTGVTTGPVSVASATLAAYNGPVFTLVNDLVVTTTQSIPGDSYSSITVQSGGNGTLAGDVTVSGPIVVQSGGRLADGCNLFTGSGSFTLSAGGTLDICRPRGILSGPNTGLGNIGAVRVLGTRSYSTDASYSYSGGNSQDTGDGLPSQVRNLSVGTSTDISLTNPLAVAQVLTLSGAGNLTTGGKTLTLLSSSAGTALVVNSGSGVVNGAATVQRYIDNSQNAGNGYRHYSAPVSNTTVADLTTTNFAPVLTQSYNTSATPPTTTPFPNVFGYDQSRVNLTNSSANFDKGFVVPASASAALTPGQGYAVNIAGTELVDFVGTLGNGNVNVPVARNGSGTTNSGDAGYQFLGNPYPAPLDLSQMTSAFTAADLTPAAYIYASSGPYVGSYRAYTNGVPASNSVVAVAQGFFLRKATAGSSATFTFANTQRLTSYGTPGSFQRPAADTRPLVQLDLVGGGLTDALYAYAQTGATPALDALYDAEKLPNPTGLNLSSTASSGEALAIDGQAAFAASTVLPLRVGVPAAGTYTLRATALDNLPAGLTAYLRDAATGQTLALAVGSTYSFSVTAAQAQAQALLLGRFTLQFSAQSPLATVAGLTATAVSIYPNPAHGQFSVTLPGVASATAVRAELLNPLGQVVRTQSAALPAVGTTLSVETSGLATGLYLLRLTAGASTLTQRVVIN